MFKHINTKINIHKHTVFSLDPGRSLSALVSQKIDEIEEEIVTSYGMVGIAIVRAREHHPRNCTLRRYRQQLLHELNIGPSDNEGYSSSDSEEREGISFDVNVDYD